MFESTDDDPPELALLIGERDQKLWRAFGRLSERCQGLLRLLVSQDEPSYEEIGAGPRDAGWCNRAYADAVPGKAPRLRVRSTLRSKVVLRDRAT